ncbi:MAG: MBL fold metallo-hydrolase [Spirochaetia bacterium]|jgi:glyoxylase-like metal-dependent hydrolase (beta-lactamase superfamily II)|nr:MBL fold metallo-hydrolase [Spirochaetia bacterium]
MKIYQHFSVVGFCNTYIIGGPEGGQAILIDPGHVDNELIAIIERNHYTLGTILLTHRHKAHTQGVGTLLKIYSPKIYAYAEKVYDFPVTRIHGDETIDCGGIKVETIHVPGHSVDSLVFKISHALFTGDTLNAGRTSSTPGYMERSILADQIEKKLMCLDGNFLLFPGHGAPSTINNERLFNPDLSERTASQWIQSSHHS